MHCQKKLGSRLHGSALMMALSYKNSLATVTSEGEEVPDLHLMQHLTRNYHSGQLASKRLIMQCYWNIQFPASGNVGPFVGVSNQIWNRMVELKMKCNGGVENGMERWMNASITNLCNWCWLSSATMCIELLSHRRGCMSKSSVTSILPCLVSWWYGQNSGLLSRLLSHSSSPSTSTSNFSPLPSQIISMTTAPIGLGTSCFLPLFHCATIIYVPWYAGCTHPRGLVTVSCMVTTLAKEGCY